MEPPGSSGLADLVRELRALAAPARSAVDGLLACWYLDFRGRTGRSYVQWTDAVTREVAAAVLFSADARPALAHLGGVRAAQGMSEVEIHDDVAALVRAADDGAFLGRPVADPEGLVDAALAGWYAASRVVGAPMVAGGTDEEGELRAALLSCLAEPPGAGATAPLLVVVDLEGDESAPDPEALRHLLPTLTSVHWPDAHWFELRSGVRYVALTDASQPAAAGLAALRGGLRVAPQLGDTKAWVWLERVPAVPDAIELFVACLGGRPKAQRDLQSRPRPRAGVHHDPRRRGSERRRRLTVAALERWTMAAAAVLVVILLAGSMRSGSLSTPSSDELVPRAPADAETPPAPGRAYTPQPEPAAPSEEVEVAAPAEATFVSTPASPRRPRSGTVELAPVPVSYVAEPAPDAGVGAAPVLETITVEITPLPTTTTTTTVPPAPPVTVTVTLDVPGPPAGAGLWEHSRVVLEVRGQGKSAAPWKSA